MAATTPTRRALGIGLAFALVGLTVGTVAAGFVNANEITACVKSDGSMRLIDPAEQTCKPNNETLVTWNVVGPTGPTGPIGPAGPAGPPGSGGGGASIATITILPGPGLGWFPCTESGDWYDLNSQCPASAGGTPGGSLIGRFAFDPADYPAGAEVTFESFLMVRAGKTFCVQLYNLTAGAAVSGSEFCLENTGTFDTYLPANAMLTGLTAGTYTLQGRHTADFGWMARGTGGVFKTTLTIDW